MPVQKLFARAVGACQALPVPVRYAITLAVTLGVFAVRRLADSVLPSGYPFLLSFIGILLCSALFDRGAGLLATLVSALLATYFYISPVGSLSVEEVSDLVALILFIAVGATVAFVVEALNRAVARANRAERARTLLLQEFRHRTRNDLNALVGLLRLRARSAPSEAARDGLQEAANHAFAMARVHARLAPDDGAEDRDPTFVDTRDFVTGLCADLDGMHLGAGLRPVAVVAEAEAHLIPSDRAVPLGLVLNEAVTNALKYAFPEDRSGTVRVGFAREGDDYLLTIRDDGLGLPEEGDLEDAPPAAPHAGSGLGTRLLRGLAAQLRGSFSRLPGEDGVGTVVTLRFPVLAPGG
ncbi:sensor histidine kinase [Muricoccus pecuniae]|uniref:histidine kinase n=1 Tax=Muricoccus pecuniae TaxID=693023 RepID=A0A840YC76_9PROT|nr:DUF4118 domain-containing protein [Roseomonas pecuniae]MBB5692142.1 two-component sensor histidine kinase [Roseomonas pecuniae]